MGKPFTIRIYVPDGDPEGMRIIDRMNWTGLGIVLPREQWADKRRRDEFGHPGVYLLVGYKSDADRPTLYIGQADNLRERIDQHSKGKEFWDAIVFRSTNNSLKSSTRTLARSRAL